MAWESIDFGARGRNGMLKVGRLIPAINALSVSRTFVGTLRGVEGTGDALH